MLACARSWMSVMVCATCLPMFSGCSTAPVRPDELPPIPANLTQPCQPLPPLVDGRQGAVVEQMLDDTKQYRLCAQRHGALVETVKFRETLYNMEKD